MSETWTVIGLMSGTSLDGLDAAVVRFEPDGPPVGRLIKAVTCPWPDDLGERVQALLARPSADLAELARLNVEIGTALADAADTVRQAANLSWDEIELIGSHGQTLWHAPTAPWPATWQWGEPAMIAARTGVTVVADFRPIDVALGGQGAPLVPLFDRIAFAGDRPVAAQNIGGIANVTYVPAGGEPSGVLAFDTGPGNMVIDRLAWLATDGRQGYDRDGHLAAAGKVRPDWLASWLADPYFSARPPKSTGREAFGHFFTDRLWAAHREQPADLLATAVALTAESIARAYRDFLPAMPARAIVSGGGVHHPGLMAELAARLPCDVVTSQDYGIDPDAKEAHAFAWLARSTFRGEGHPLAHVTGARAGWPLGKIVPGANFRRIAGYGKEHHHGP